MNTIPTNADSMLSELLKIADPEAAVISAQESAKRWDKLTKLVFDTTNGRKWLSEAIRRYNLMGSVFPASMCEKAAAFNDGRRSVISEILNAVARARVANTDDDEEPAEKM